MITIPSLNNVTDILDTDMIMVTQQSGQSYKIAGSELNKRGKIIIANSTTITGAPLKAGSSVRVYFTVDLTAANASTTLQLNYNNVNYYVKAPKDGTLINFVATNLGGSPAVYKYLQKYTTLELLFDGTQFVIIGNPVILSSADYTIYADGLQRVNSVASGNKNMVTSNAVADVFNMQNNDNELKDITGQLSTIGVGITGVTAYRKNNMIFLRIIGTYTGVPTNATQTVIQGLPQKYRPKEQQICVGLAHNSISPYVYPTRLTIHNDGHIDFSECAFPNNASIRIGIMYIAD